MSSLMDKTVDVIIIGGGVIGCAIAYELSKLSLKICVLEAEADLAFGASGANTGLVHAGFDPKPGSLKAKYNVEGNKLFPKLAEDLNIQFQQTGALVLAKTDNELSKLEELKHRGKENKVLDLNIKTGEDLSKIEPNINKDILWALHAPSAGIISPYEFTIALAECAAGGGTEFLLNTHALEINLKNGSVHQVITNKSKIKTSFIINAAGIFSDDIAKMVGLNTLNIHPRRGEYLVFDKSVSGLVRHTLFPVPSKVSKGIIVTPTVEGNILVGPNAEDIDDKSDKSTTSEGLEEVYKGSKKLVPNLSKKDVIATFSGIRPVPDVQDFIIGSTQIPGFINAAGISSPGLTAAPAIAKAVVSIVSNDEISKKLKIKPNPKFNTRREKQIGLKNTVPAKFDEIIRKNSTYGHVVCRCEHVTEGEVLQAIHTCPGATTLKGIKYRTRAGLGRCHGAFCNQSVIFILSSELGIPVENVTLSGPGSEILFKTGKGE
jgi:glycerol-3-phosphate dehydrogenase